MALDKAIQKAQTRLRAVLQDEKAAKLENLAAALLGRLLGVTVAVAQSGFQYGGDAGTAGRQGRRLRVECKKYGDKTDLSERELLGEIDQALSRDPALEAWVLVATRDVSEQLEQSLNQKGESVGVPVVVLDWKSEGLASLAALCAFAPDLVESVFSAEAGALARTLQPVSAGTVERLRLDLQTWSLGFEVLRTRSLAILDKIWQIPRVSNSALGQNAAGGAEDRKVRRRAVHDALDRWWNGAAKDDAPVAVVGWDGVGKTWATLAWLVAQRKSLPIVLVVPSSAAADISGASETAMKRFLADRLYDLTSVRDGDHWLRRLDNLLRRPADEGPILTVFFDGLNQEPSIPWLPLLKVLQGEAFQCRVRVIVSTRTHHYQNKLTDLRGLIVPAVLVPVDLYDTSPGGELDQMLAFEDLTRKDLHPDLIELARTPRLFRLVVKFRERLVEAGQVTIHRLLWEYGRDTFGTRLGRSFSESDWRAWLQEIAQRHRDGMREFSLKSLGETASRPDLSESEVYARLSDIIDGQFTTLTPSGNLQFKPTVVAHALGAALLVELDAVTSPTFDSVNTELTQWLDPIAGLDQRAEILRAAVSILVERGDTTATPVAGVLVTAWLQTQNVTDAHRRELAGLATSLCNALLDAIEHSGARTHASARLWAVNALRAIQRPNPSALTKIVARIRRWLSTISRDVQAPELINADIEKSRSERFLKRIGVDASGPLQVLGLELQLVDRDEGVLAATVPSILEGFPLAEAAPAFEAAAIALAIGGRNESWAGLKWLCLLNDVDPVETATALRTLSAAVHKRTPEAGVNSALPARVASLLLWLTGEEGDETAAATIDPGLDDHFTYAKDYLPRPGRSLFALERRHVEGALNDTELRLLFRIQRSWDLWLDPTFEPPPSFVQEVREAAIYVEVEKLNRHGSYTTEDHNFEELEPVLARCAPDLLADMIRRKLQSYRTCPPEARYWSAIHATDHLVLAGEAESAASRVLRLSAQEATENDELYAASQLLILELHSQTAPHQADAVIRAALKHILVDIDEILRPLTPDEADVLIARFGMGSVSQRRDLVILLSHNRNAFSDTAWSWLTAIAFGADADLHGLAYRTLASSDAKRFGRELSARNWTWSAKADYWVNHYGTSALIEASTALPFDQVAPRFAPWRLLEAARRRGADPSEVRLAAGIFGRILAADQIQAPDAGSTLSVDRTEDVSTPFQFSVTPTQSETDPKHPFAALRAAMDVEARLKAHKRAVETAVKRIREARESGASLYLANVDAADLEPGLLYAPDLVGDWLEGSNESTTEFERRVRLAEAAYLALCEALLAYDAPRGAALWRSLRKVLTIRFIGDASVDELIHIPFRVPDTPAAAELRAELIRLDRCHTDQDLLNLVIAATFNGKVDWLSTIIEEDKASPLAWRRRRGTVLEGFTSHNNLPIADAWPDGEIRTGHEDLRRKSARFRYYEACAHHWWRTYLASEDGAQAYAAWVLFLRAADRRAWVWINGDTQAVSDTSAFFKLKISHARLNRSKLRRAMKKREDKLDKRFLNRDIVDGIGPWGKEST